MIGVLRKAVALQVYFHDREPNFSFDIAFASSREFA